MPLLLNFLVWKRKAIYLFLTFSILGFNFVFQKYVHDALKVFVCLRSVLSLFLLDHLPQVDNCDDMTVFPLIIKRVIVSCLLKHVDGSATGKKSQLYLYLYLSALVLTSEILNFHNQLIDLRGNLVIGVNIIGKLNLVLVYLM